MELQSIGTEATDRGAKLLEYQTIPSLTDYLLVSQQTPLVEHYARGEAGHWDYQAVRGTKGVLAVPSVAITPALSDIYDQIVFGEGADD